MDNSNRLWIEGDVPPQLLPILEKKVKAQALDAGDAFSLCMDESCPKGHQYQLITTKSLEKDADVFLIDHAVSFADEAQLKQQIESHDVIRDRLAALLEMDHQHSDSQADDIMEAVWPLVGSYALPSRSGPRNVFYIMDEVGSRLASPLHDVKGEGEEGDGRGPGFCCTLVIDLSCGMAFNAFWPIRYVEESEIATCLGLPHTQALRLGRLHALEVFDADDDDDDEEEEGETVIEKELEEGINAFKSFLEAKAYTNVDVTSRLLGLKDLGLLPVWEISNPQRRQGFQKQLAEAEDRSLAVLISLFLMGCPTPRDQVEQDISRDILQTLSKLRLLVLEREGEKELLRSAVQLTPVAHTNGCIFATDYSQIGRGSGFDPVMYVGVDSLGLVAAAPREKKAKRAIDFCSGCGIQGIVASKTYASDVTLVELNPRAIRFARFNIYLNGCQGRVKAIQADLMSPKDVEKAVQCGPFDVILANPPYIPNPDKSAKSMHKYGDGGPSGEEVTQAIIRSIPRLLAQDGGWLYLVANLVNVTDLPKRFINWWESIPENKLHCNMKTYYGIRWSASEYASLIHNRASLSDPAVIYYAERLEKTGVKDVCNGLVFAHIAKAPFQQQQPDEQKSIDRVESKGNIASAHFVIDQLWQVVSIGGPEAEKILPLC